MQIDLPDMFAVLLTVALMLCFILRLQSCSLMCLMVVASGVFIGLVCKSRCFLADGCVGVRHAMCFADY